MSIRAERHPEKKERTKEQARADALEYARQQIQLGEKYFLEKPV